MQAVRRVLFFNAAPRWDEGSAVEYVRQARRLRWRHRHSPARLHRQLRDLARRQPAEAAFSTSVADAIHGGILTYSRRDALLRTARRRGIDPFEARLMMALAQHRAPDTRSAIPKQHPAVPHWLMPILLVLIVQGLLLAAAWRVWS